MYSDIYFSCMQSIFALTIIRAAYVTQQFQCASSEYSVCGISNIRGREFMCTHFLLHSTRLLIPVCIFLPTLCTKASHSVQPMFLPLFTHLSTLWTHVPVVFYPPSHHTVPTFSNHGAVLAVADPHAPSFAHVLAAATRLARQRHRQRLLAASRGADLCEAVTLPGVCVRKYVKLPWHVHKTINVQDANNLAMPRSGND